MNAGAQSGERADRSVRLLGITKRFGRTVACDSANFHAAAGSVSALVGENGAGKTTLMRILAGELIPDAGTVMLGGRGVEFRSPRDATAAGVAMVEQEPRVIPALTVLENIILGAEESAGGILKRGMASGRVAEVFSDLGLDVALDSPAAALNPSQCQRLAIARALYRGVRILILDEPTSLLGPTERGALFGVMKRLAGRGAAIIFISHKLAEVFEVADTVTVLRHGETISSRAARETSPAEVSSAMVGASFQSEAGHRAMPGEMMVRLAKVSTGGEGRTALKGVSLDLRRGEIIGVAGVAGNGQRALSDVVAGLVKPSSGDVTYPFGRPSAALVGEDVDAMDLAGGMTVWENRILGREGEFSAWWGIAGRRSRMDVRRLAEELDIRGDADAPVSALSGGNRQRLVLARELDHAPDLLILEEPTRGLDIRGAELVRRRIRETATSGSAVLLISYDLDELYALADVILVLSSGKLLEPTGQPPMRSEIASLMTT